MKHQIRAVIGIAAFVIGGLIAREKTVEGFDTIENVIHKRKKIIARGEKAKTELREIVNSDSNK